MSLFVMLDVLCSDVAGWAPSAQLYANLEWVFILKIFLQIGNSWKKNSEDSPNLIQVIAQVKSALRYNSNNWMRLAFL